MGKSQVSKIQKKIKKGKAEQKILPMVPAITSLISQVARKSALSNLETKYVTGGSVNGIGFNSAIGSNVEFYPLIPPVNPGTGDWERMGDQLLPLSITTDFFICLTNVNRSQNLLVNLYLLESKTFKNFDSLKFSSNNNAQLLKSGGSSRVQTYNGLIADAGLPINTESFKLLKHYQFQLASNVGLSNGDTTAGHTPNLPSPMSFKRIRYNYKPSSPAKLKYEPASGSPWPSNAAPFWALGYAKVDGSSPDVGNQNVTVTTQCGMTYKDA